MSHNYPHDQSPRSYSPSGVCAICGEWVEKLQMDHIDPDGLHDTSNLQWLCWPCHYAKTGAENRARLAGRRTQGSSKLTMDQAREIRARYGSTNRRQGPKDSPTLAQIGLEYGISIGQVSTLLAGKSYVKEVMPSGD